MKASMFQKIAENPSERCNPDTSIRPDARRTRTSGAAFSQYYTISVIPRGVSFILSRTTIAVFSCLPRDHRKIHAAIESAWRSEERRGEAGGSITPAKNRDKWEPVNFHISRATSRVYAVASEDGETPHLVRLADALSPYSTSVDSNLEFGACKPNSRVAPVGGGSLREGSKAGVRDSVHPWYRMPLSLSLSLAHYRSPSFARLPPTSTSQETASTF